MAVRLAPIKLAPVLVGTRQSAIQIRMGWQPALHRGRPVFLGNWTADDWISWGQGECQYSPVSIFRNALCEVFDANRRILSITQQIIDESSQGQEVVECGRFRVIVKYQVGCPPPGHPVDHTLDVIGNIQEDAVSENVGMQLLQNNNDELCTYEKNYLYRMKNRLDQGIGTGFTSYRARLTYRDISVQKHGPGIATRATIPGIGPCP